MLNKNLDQLIKMTKIIQVYKSNLTKNQPNLLDKKELILKRELNKEAIKMANDLLKNSKIIALPTDTIYGITCLINNESLNKLIEIKQRDSISKAFVICVNTIDDIYKWSKVTVNREVLNDLLPGPITVLFERNELLNKNLNPNRNLIGIRIPDHDFVNSLTYLNNPLVLTSANLSNEPSAGQINEFKNIWPNLDAIFDGGKLNELNCDDPFKLGSTIIDLSKPNKFKIIRKGCAIDRVLNILQYKYSFEEDN